MGMRSKVRERRNFFLSGAILDPAAWYSYNLESGILPGIAMMLWLIWKTPHYEMNFALHRHTIHMLSSAKQETHVTAQ